MHRCVCFVASFASLVFTASGPVVATTTTPSGSPDGTCAKPATTVSNAQVKCPCPVDISPCPFGEVVEVGTTCDVTCDQGYHVLLMGPDVTSTELKCLSDGSYGPIVPCVRIGTYMK